ncbi:subtilisin inhibitor-like [Rutidosis leptorrhynchoides]|uniref:subtilisin inhibitor-like n=1 Tax=Rutidosis leptorrhynchoides TaxID=125765 RepID=UPI003A9A2B7B
MSQDNQQSSPILIKGQPITPASSAKTNWPELVGWKADDAEKKIKEEMPRATVQVVPHDSFVTMDFKSTRVRLYVDSAQTIVKEPRTG